MTVPISRKVLARTPARCGDSKRFGRAAQRVVGRHGLGREHVHGGHQPARPARDAQRVEVDEARPAQQQEHRAGLRQRELGGADHAPAALGQRRRHDDDVAVAEHVGEGRRDQPARLELPARQPRVVDAHRARERSERVEHGPPGQPEADEAERAAVQQPVAAGARVAVALAPLPEREVGAVDVARERQREAERELADGAREDGSRRQQPDAEPLAVGVGHVGAEAPRVVEHRPQVAAAREVRSRQRRAADDVARAVEVGGVERVARLGAALDRAEARREPAQHRVVEVVGALLRGQVQEQDRLRHRVLRGRDRGPPVVGRPRTVRAGGSSCRLRTTYPTLR